MAKLTDDSDYDAGETFEKPNDLLLGDLAILLGCVCCLDRYWAQLSGLVPPQDARILDLTRLISPSAERTSIDTKVVTSLSDGTGLFDCEFMMRRLTDKCGIRWKAYLEIRQMRRQLTDIQLG
ncbi:unnamed protein product [Protopolystoma xenopodis]|uniref:Uncharacterized protein n=1 Tax=Protopolystoma xenopodis TaxID=117903 RepID=A0A3S5C6J1_9PLAT|nr:unnamed protein product [Protopolystoma xenopodis]